MDLSIKGVNVIDENHFRKGFHSVTSGRSVSFTLNSTLPRTRRYLMKEISSYPIQTVNSITFEIDRSSIDFFATLTIDLSKFIRDINLRVVLKILLDSDDYESYRKLVYFYSIINGDLEVRVKHLPCRDSLLAFLKIFDYIKNRNILKGYITFMKLEDKRNSSMFHFYLNYSTGRNSFYIQAIRYLENKTWRYLIYIISDMVIENASYLKRIERYSNPNNRQPIRVKIPLERNRAVLQKYHNIILILEYDRRSNYFPSEKYFGGILGVHGKELIQNLERLPKKLNDRSVSWCLTMLSWKMLFAEFGRIRNGKKIYPNDHVSVRETDANFYEREFFKFMKYLF